MGTAIPSWSVCWHAELFVRGSGCHRARHAQRKSKKFLSRRDGADRVLGMRAVPWSPDGNDNAFDIQVGMERPRRWCLASPGEVLMENKVARTHLRRADFDQWGLSEGCPGCRYLRTGQERQQAHSEACRMRIEGLLKGDLSESARLAAAHERIIRALTDAVERHATKDPGMRGILKRASVVCHPESEPQKKIALVIHRAGLDTTPFTLVRRIISIPRVTTSTDQNTGTSDVTGEGEGRTRARRDSNKQQGSHLWRCRDGGDSADENSA